MKNSLKMMFFAAAISAVISPVRADEQLLAALMDAEIPMTEDIATLVRSAQSGMAPDAVAAVIAGIDSDGLLIEKIIAAAVAANPDYAVAIVSAAITAVPAAAAIITGAAVGAVPDQVGAIIGAAVSLVPTMAQAIIASASAAAPSQSAVILAAAETNVSTELPGTGETTPPSPN